VVIPPTYVRYTARTALVRACLAAWLAAEGYGLAPARLPLKTLAVRSGVAAYGRNNICFVAGMGSFLQLVGAFTDLPCTEDPWGEPRALDRCEACVACVNQCPTGAIARDRFLLRAERCLTYHNEGPDGFADWIDPSWHHCLVGCMRCQSVCPENEAVLGWCEDRFDCTKEETALLVNGTPLDRLPPGTATRLRSLELNENHRLLCRNLGALLEAPDQAT
jgi:epoxyqueuosine reductase